MRPIRCALMVALALAAADARGSFHLWKMTEIYSNADGSVQFLELAVSSNGEGLLANHTITSIVPAGERSYTFTTNLPFDTGGKTMLIATEGFAALGLVTPDYVVPNGFFSAAGGRVNFADVDAWEYPPLPATGGMSLDRDGTRRVNSPKNFVGSTGSVGEPLPLNVQALWWGSPNASESGWGLNITHQGEILFATWFTYDVDGRGMWLVAPDARRTTGNTYTGPLYRTTGPAFSSATFDPSRIVVTPVGTATFSFTAASAGTFAYTVDGISQVKPITRQVFDVSVPTCTAGGPAGAANYQDLWWRSPAGSESGWGVNLTHQGNVIFATWFTYDAAGRGMWMVMSEGRLGAAGVYTGRLYRTTGPAFNAVPFNPALVAVTDVGTGTFTFANSGSGTFAYTVDGITQSKSIERQVYSAPATVCR
jgi:hypothetical protein